LAASILAALESYLYKFYSIEKKVDFFIAPSRFLHEKFIEYGWPSEKFFHTFYHLYPYPNLKEDISIKERYGVYLGGLVPWKGVDILIEACKWINDFKIRILGDGAMRNELENQVQSLGLNNVSFEGHKRKAELNNILRRASFLVIPSRWYENCPYVIMEAQSFGIPVIGTNIGGIKNLVDDGENGLLFELNSSKDLAKKINYLIESPDVTRIMGLKASSKAKREYSPELHYNRIINIYQNITR